MIVGLTKLLETDASVQFRLFFQPFVQFALTNMGVMFLVKGSYAGITTITFLSQIVWWYNIRQQHETDHKFWYAPYLYAAGATSGALFCAWLTH